MAVSITQNSDQLKYKLRELKNNLPKDVTVELIVNQYLKPHNISIRTFNDDCALKLSDAKSIPEFRLQVYSKAFGVPLYALLNYTVKQKPIKELHEESKKDVIAIQKEFE